MPGKLFVVGTPIGNLGDITYRAVETLKSVDFICAEDTRVTIKLLNHFEIKKRLVSYHEHSVKQVSEDIINHILSGESCAVVSDAGMPCISDPGEDLVRRCIENDIPIEVVPGPTAMASAVAISGLSVSRFSFEGFLSVTKKQRYSHLEEAAKDTHTLIFYEAPHKLVNTLNDMLEYFGDRKISICRELTKIHEEVIRTTISGAIEYYADKNPKGEFVLVVEGYSPEKVSEGLTIDDAVEKAQGLISEGMRAVDACKEAAKITGFKKSDIYSRLQ
ncbi:MAG: 16S rRNA (cytidine(1402)-2'-O)-methyltransferase [Oscillospiraceae bacterium]|nr:16S rRNA (cytidine(1402)-2'-O)-methyltransferase [Oscillospiraceae bacterium]